MALLSNWCAGMDSAGNRLIHASAHSEAGADSAGGLRNPQWVLWAGAGAVSVSGAGAGGRVRRRLRLRVARGSCDRAGAVAIVWRAAGAVAEC